jgi:osmotically-inducible protein OsmY
LRIILLITIIISSLLLQSCFTATGTAVAGAAVIYKRKVIEDYISDQTIESGINNAYFNNGELWQQNRIIVTCVNRIVLLTGEVRNQALLKKALALANTVPGIQKIYNQISISTPVSLFQQMQDAAITIIIKLKMLGAENFDPSNIKVVTNNNVVYLIGVVTPEQSDRSSKISSNTSGVSKVVKVFQYIT